MRRNNYILLLTLLTSIVCAARALHTRAVASINARGISGNVYFELLDNGSVSIQTELIGLTGPGNYNWHVHTLPVDQTLDPAVQCLNKWVGPHYNPNNANTSVGYSTRCTENTPTECEAGDLAGRFGPLMPMSNVVAIDNTGDIALEGRNSIIGRALVIHSNVDGSNFVCGTIRIEEEDRSVILLQASFISPLAGTIYFRQVDTENVQIFGKLYWTRDQPNTINHNWHIHMTAPNEFFRTSNCTTVMGHFNPENRNVSDPNYLPRCMANITQCEVGDLTGKHGQINISATPAPFVSNSFFFTDTYLNLTAVRGRSVAVHEADGGPDIIACAPLIDSERITLNQPINSYLNIAQNGPHEDTIVTTTNIPASVESISVQEAAINPINNCEPIGGEYTPYPPNSSVSTPDSRPLGSWTERYMLTSNSVLRLFNVPVYGTNVTIASKSMRSVSTSDGRVSSTCVSIIPMLTGSDIIVAKATFTGSEYGPIDGAVYFVQRKYGNKLGNTHIIVDIQYDTDQASTSGHNWHVHQYPPQSGSNCTASIGGHYNPFGVSLANQNSPESPSMNSNYSDDCDPLYPLRCEAGDLSGKHGQLDIYPDVSRRVTYTYVDPNVQLDGTFSIIGLSIGLHNNTGPLFDCGTINRVHISQNSVTVNTDANRLRTEIARKLVADTTIDYSDVLFLNQERTQPFGVSCVSLTARVLGETQAQADMNYEMVARNAETLQCNGAIVGVSSLSVMLLAMCVLLTTLFN